MIRRLVAVSSLLLVMLLAQVGSLTAQEVEFETSLDQARVFIKKGWYREAIKELRRAITTSQGEKSFDAHYLLAQACYKEFDIGCAVKMSDTARGLARSPEQRTASQNVVDYLARNFGKVEFQAGPGEVSEGYLELVAQDPILDRDVKNYYKMKVEPLAEQRRTLPWLLYLPVNTYKLYGQEFSVEGGQELTVNAGFTAENSKPKPEKAPPEPDFEGVGIALQLRVGGGAALLNGPNTVLGAVADLSLHKTLGEKLAVGAFAKFNYDLGITNSALTYGGMVTFNLPLAKHILFSPALGYGLGEGPATVFSDCAVSLANGKEVLTCGGGAGDVTATLGTRMQGPLLRLEAAYKKQTEKRIMAAQLGLQAHYGLLSSVPAGSGHYEGDDSTLVGYSVADGVKLSPLRAELLAGFNMTF